MLEEISYSPVIYSKNSELSALKNLRDELRPKIFPIISLKPLPHAHELAHTLNRIDESKPGRFGLDIDWHTYGRVKSLTDPNEFDRLFLHNDGFQNYFNLVDSIAGAVPVLVRCDGEYPFLDSQIDRALELGKGLIVRIEREKYHGLDYVLDQVTGRVEDVVFLVDAGWSQEILLAQPWTYQMIKAITERNSEAEIIIASSSFPKSFSHMGKKGISSNDDRELFRRMRQMTNAQIVYGDWASTRKSIEATPMKAVPRLDLAHSNEWLSYRRIGQEGYFDIADRLVNDLGFQLTADCWGKNNIADLAAGNLEAVKGAAKATASRINMHLTVQALVDSGEALPEETSYADPF